MNELEKSNSHFNRYKVFLGVSKGYYLNDVSFGH